jgi:hypothetical protein
MRFNKLLYQALFPILRAWSQVTFGLHGGLQFGFKDGGRVIVPVLFEFAVCNRNETESHFVIVQLRAVQEHPELSNQSNCLKSMHYTCR